MLIAAMHISGSTHASAQTTHLPDASGSKLVSANSFLFPTVRPLWPHVNPAQHSLAWETSSVHWNSGSVRLRSQKGCLAALPLTLYHTPPHGKDAVLLMLIFLPLCSLSWWEFVSSQGSPWAHPAPWPDGRADNVRGAAEPSRARVRLCVEGQSYQRSNSSKPRELQGAQHRAAARLDGQQRPKGIHPDNNSKFGKSRFPWIV